MDLLHDLMTIVWTQVIKEPVVREPNPNGNSSTSLIADVSTRGVWTPQSTATFDICVIDSDSPFYLTKSSSQVLTTAE